MNIAEIEHIYYCFRKAQSEYKNRGFRMPKDFEKHFNNRFQKTNRESLRKITGLFLTKWINIDPFLYFKCGFELYKNNFTYTKFFKEPILNLYIQRDKAKKRELEANKKNIIKSAVHLKGTGYSLRDYIMTRDGARSLAIADYLKNNIDAYFLVWLIKRHGLRLTDADRSDIPYIHSNFRKISVQIEDLKNFFRKVEQKL